MENKVGVNQNTISKFNSDLEKKIYKKIANCWRLHKHNCYHENSDRYYCYGQIGWKFCDEWSPFNPNGLLNNPVVLFSSILFILTYMLYIGSFFINFSK